MERASGVLLPVFSLPSKYGIGGFSKEAYEWVDLLRQAGQSYWQILPLGPTGESGSPYQSFSAFAGNPYFISLDTLAEEGLLTEEECARADAAQVPNEVSYGRLYETRLRVLRQAFQRFAYGRELPEAFLSFCEKNRDWLDDYCLFSVIKAKLGGRDWNEWPEELRDRDGAAMAQQRDSLRGEIAFYQFLQYEFRKQWDALKAYANEKGIRIVGDIPIYVSMDSADAWSEPELFQFGADHKPIGVAGCPPDVFSKTGQLWGNPLYDWDYHRRTGYAWWIRRMRNCAELYDVVRIDHFRGFNDYYSIPYGDETAENGHWEKGPGMDLFRRLKEALGEQDYIAEDLGLLTDEVRQLVKDSGYPGMKILEFAFEGGPDNSYLPHQYETNAVVYTGTHDNDTAEAFLAAATDKMRAWMEEYCGHPVQDAWDLIRLAQGSVAKLCVIPMQDYLGLGSEARVNTPSTATGNWRWRLTPGQVGEETAARMRRVSERYSRVPGKWVWDDLQAAKKAAAQADAADEAAAEERTAEATAAEETPEKEQ